MQGTLRSMAPTGDMLSELAGRMYEGLDILMAVEDGKIGTVEDLKNWLQESVAGLDRTIQAGLKGEPVMVDDDCCVVFRAAGDSASAVGG
ncbi:hypothetical protein [Trinickia mobilis]|uniref:hypothetical protein n=1 Tax=Trinickia mobilis TaxID=2816356 RepID=UPI001A8D893F|nr:hypothetical protein [Trinickia mobilis]